MSHYQLIEVESFYPKSTSGRHGEVHVRPVSGQAGLSQDLYVECSRSLIKKYPVGTKFRIKGKLSTMKGQPYIYSYHGWSYEVL